MALSDPPESELEPLHVARSRFIDAYGATEAIICERLRLNGIDPGNRSVGQKIEALRGVKASPRYSKNERKRIHELLEKLEAENEIRCDIVHSELKIVRLDGTVAACFINTKHRRQTTTVARLVTLGQFDQMIDQLKTIAAELTKFAG